MGGYRGDERLIKGDLWLIRGDLWLIRGDLWLIRGDLWLIRGDLWQGFGSGSGSVLDPYSIGPLDPDPDP
jgi:hypothetical protein